MMSRNKNDNRHSSSAGSVFSVFIQRETVSFCCSFFSQQQHRRNITGMLSLFFFCCRLYVSDNVCVLFFFFSSRVECLAVILSVTLGGRRFLSPLPSGGWEQLSCFPV